MRRVNLRTAVAFAEIVTALAVVASLLYAASEFRRSRALTTADVESLLYSRMLEMDRLLIEDRDLADILVAAGERPDNLTPADKARYLAYEHIFYDSWELAWSAHEDGVFGDEAWADWDDWFTAEARRRPLAGWEGNRQNAGDRFAGYVDRRLGDVRPSDR